MSDINKRLNKTPSYFSKENTEVPMEKKIEKLAVFASTVNQNVQIVEEQLIKRIEKLEQAQ